MALHVRRQIARAGVAVLQRDVGVSVFEGRAAPISTAKMPYLLVYARSEESRPTSLDDRRYRRLLTLLVEIVIGDGADSDAALDAMCLKVEKAMADDPQLGGLAEDLVLVRSELAARFESETRIARGRLEYTVEYHTPASRPDQHLE